MTTANDRVLRAKLHDTLAKEVRNTIREFARSADEDTVWRFRVDARLVDNDVGNVGVREFVVTYDDDVTVRDELEDGSGDE